MRNVIGIMVILTALAEGFIIYYISTQPDPTCTSCNREQKEIYYYMKRELWAEDRYLDCQRDLAKAQEELNYNIMCVADHCSR